MTCVIHEGRYCPGCLIRYAAAFYGDDFDEDFGDDADDYVRETLEHEHEAQCRPYQAHRVMESLRFFARLDAVRAPGSW